MLTTKEIFDRYQEVRSRFPAVNAAPETLDIDSLLDISDDVDAFIFDALAF